MARLRRAGALLLCAGAVLTFFAKASALDDTGYRWSLPRGFPVPAVPADNPMSDAKVALGRRLFSEPKLSITGRHSCASCHQAERAFTDGLARAVGAKGDPTPHNAMSLTNVAYNVSFGWSNRRARSLEEQMLEPLLNEHPVELGLAGREAEVIATLTADERYRRELAAAFPEAHGRFALTHVVKSIAAFERTLISGSSPFDQYVFQGRHDALNAEAKRGMALFYSERLGCAGCHGGFNFAGAWMDAQGTTGEPTFANNGVGAGSMRVPTLRNLASTAPYMHDGSFSTIEAVLAHYERAGPRPFALTPEERRALIAFLHSLCDPTFPARPDGERTHSVSR
jgi:cytochrome c peroxidase